MSGNQPPGASGPSWTIDDSAEEYRVPNWGMGFFEIGPNGHLFVRIDDQPEQMIDLYEVVTGLQERGISTPVTIGFPQMVGRRMRDLNEAFVSAIRENQYTGSYAGVYPIKVNQQLHLVQEIEHFGRDLGFGLEVGSKPELLAVMGLTTEAPERLIVCNGFKEERYIRHIFLATKLGRNIVAVIETRDELELLIDFSRELGVRPQIGVRLKLESLQGGRWHGSTGERAKFGLTIPGVLEVVERLRDAEMLDCLNLLHCHMGSQLSDIQVINSGIHELSRVFVEVRKLGAKLQYLDVGGGLGVDYDGSKTNWDFSTNYGLQEYATTVVYRIKSICDEAGIEHPTIVTEAGRALVTHYCALVTNVLGANCIDRYALEPEEAAAACDGENRPRVLDDLLEAFRSVVPGRLLESYHDALQAREEALTLFRVGLLDLEDRGLVDRLFWSTCLEIARSARELDPCPEELQELEQRLADIYFCNLSVFQSLPDSWAIDQVFPIVPIHRLDERPTRRATLADITCDSDGKIDRFVDQEDVATVLPVHPLIDGEPYFLAIFLVGAYQETLGDLHNLFGDAHLVHIRYDEEEGWYVDEVVRGDTVSEVLSYLQYDPHRLYSALRRDCERSVRAKKLTAAESRDILEMYESGLAGYTYLEVL